MNYIGPILKITPTIKKMADTMKSNKDSCRRIAERVQAVERLVLNIRQSDPSQISHTVNETLKELYTSLNSAKALIEKLSQTKAVEGFFKSGSIESKLNKINQRLTENFQTLSGALQIEQTNMLQKVYAAVSRQSTEEEVCSMMANTNLTPSMLPSSPVSSPTASMLPPVTVSSPTAPMLPPAPVSLPQYSQLPPTPVYSPTTPLLPSMPLSNPTAAMPVTYVMPPISVSTPYVRQPVYSTTTSHFIVTNNVASRPVIQTIRQGSVTGIRTVAPITLPAQNTPIVSAYVVKNAF